MQEWLKDKKNLPIVAALMVVMLLVAGGVIALETGAFDSHSAAAPSAQTTQGIPGGPSVGTGGPSYPSSTPNGGSPLGGRPGLPPGLPQGRAPGTTAATVAVTPKSDIVNPLIGPDPFGIPGGAQKAAKARAALAGPKLALRNVIGPLDLFRIHPPTPPEPPIVIDGVDRQSPSPAANIRLSGLVNGPDGNIAILEVSGQSQSAKPGDTLADGTNVQSIQSTSVTLKSPGGSVFILPLSAGTPDQGTTPFNGQPQYPGGFNGQPQYPGGFNGQPQVN